MHNVLFIMFQGGGMSPASWNYGDAKFLNKLKKLGNVYIYYNKLYNIGYYIEGNNNWKEYDSNIDFDMDYLNMDKHNEILFNDIKDKYDITKIKLVPVGWSLGGFFATAFAQKYKIYCKFVVLLDSSTFSKNGIDYYMKMFNKTHIAINKIKNKDLKNLQEKIMKNAKITDIRKLSDIANTLFIVWVKKNLKTKFKIPVLNYRNINLSIDKKDIEWNIIVQNHIENLSKINKSFKNIYVINEGHGFFMKKDVAIDIINNIKQYLK